MLRGLGPDPFPNGVPLKGTETLKKSGVALGDSVSERVEEEKENEEVVHESEIAFRLDGVERLLGSRPLQILRNSHVAVVGVGGVGSWVVEALARSGVGRLTLIDLDDVCVSNVNRQLCALTSTVGELKIDVLKARVREINPACDVRLIADFVVPDNAGDLLFEQEWGAPDLVVECIDTASEKCAIIEECRKRNTPVVVAGSVGGKFDPTKVEVSDLGRTHGDALLFQVRKKLRSKFGFPGRPASPRKKEKDRDWGVAAVYVPESFETSSAFSPSSSDSSSSPSDSEEDLSFSSTTKREDVEEDGEQGLDCTRFGTVAFLSGTVGMTAASAAVRILALNEQTYRWQPALLALGREGEEVGEGQNAPSEGMEDGKEAGEEREKASGVIGKSEPGEQKQEAGTEGGKGGRKVNGAPGGSGVAVAGSSGPLPLQPVELLQVADAHCHLHLTKRKDARSEREVVGDMQRDGGKTVALQSLSERVRGEGEEKGEAAIAVSGDLETLRERGASSSTSAAARASSSSSSGLMPTRAA
uniref:THIF-type NAD/FAD binding fold domain-containing protein n=1 Tax=Chromera velia CCMP2878 TaxID=1169474 RepID=A0A0G4I4E1_9ALVE|eukprot:Cvel_10901.t1-p1 / transcript=Cvel_10901.t1 / gene=Cvel_10901 / organism=Chromera_velia_CCMP2878 / gene_product=Uncharacterized protein HI_0118, putative / transcript_product=Uncharacterized protein HI_0118, putative / location=Cvel_scaffold669:10481-12570(-) / protein_length=529 / sequence_SO=supercontig / SO=protein_coding / is_pseudo=false